MAESSKDPFIKDDDVDRDELQRASAQKRLSGETPAATIGIGHSELRGSPIIPSEWLSLPDAARYAGYSEDLFSRLVTLGIAPKSVLFSGNVRRFRRVDVEAWCAAGGLSAFRRGGASRRSSAKTTPIVAHVLELLQTAYPRSWKQLLRNNLGERDPADLTPAELVEFTDHVCWMTKQAGIRNPLAWLEFRRQSEANGTPAKPALVVEINSESELSSTVSPADKRLTGSSTISTALTAVADLEPSAAAGDEIAFEGRRFLSERRLAATLGYSQRQVQRWRKEHTGPPCTNIGRKWYYEVTKLQEWIESQGTRGLGSLTRM